MIKAKSTDIDDLIDPKVKHIKKKLIYCDYIENKKLKSGYKNNYKIKHKLDYRFKKEILENQMSVASVALKYLHNNPITNKLNNAIKINENIFSVNCKNKNSNSFESKSEKVPNIFINRKTIENSCIDKKLQEQLKHVDKVPSDWMTDYEIYNDNHDKNESHESLFGTPNPTSIFSSIICGGCGALLHCKDITIPGYLPSELLMHKTERDLKSITCQRCHFIKFYNTFLDVKIPPDNYLQFIKKLDFNKKAAILLLIDLTDFPCSIWPQLQMLIGNDRHVFVVGNKIDLLPKDSPNFLEHVKDCLKECIIKTGISSINIKYIGLISAKTGYGIEELINKLHNKWENKGDLYVIGCTNSGKSTLFNILLNSDLCKSQSVDLIQHATTSFWPGTTVNVLKFPMLKPSNKRTQERIKRLISDRNVDTEEENLRLEEFKRTKNIELMTLQGRVIHTFKRKNKIIQMLKQLNTMDTPTITPVNKTGIDEESVEYKHGHWFYDTPGTISPDQILDLLTTEELKKTIPDKIISPRTFCIWSKQTIFIAGLGRLDILTTSDYIRCTIFASNFLPITICETKDANLVYSQLIQTEAFVVPINTIDRLKIWPELDFKDLEVTGVGHSESASDIVLSNIGWVAVTGNNNDIICIKAWTPLGKGIYLRTPSLLPKSVNLRGMRRVGSPAYRLGQQVYAK